MTVYLKYRGYGKRTFIAIDPEKLVYSIKSFKEYLLSRGIKPEVKIVKKRNSNATEYVRIDADVKNYTVPEELKVVAHNIEKRYWVSAQTKKVRVLEAEELISSGQFTKEKVAGFLSSLERDSFYPNESKGFWDLKNNS